MRGLTITLTLAALVATGSALLAYTVQPVAPQAEHVGPPAGYDLVPAFADEFDGAALNTGSWGQVFAPKSHKNAAIEKRSLYGNGERQVYFDRDYLALGIDPVRIKDGVLTITAAPLDARALAAVKGDLARSSPQFHKTALSRVAYSSGTITTRDRFAQLYGYFEIRARWSSGKGLWPSFWLVPSDGSWPPEIDIVEAHGDKPNTAYQSTHSKIAPKAVTRTVSVAGSTEEFHRYGALWLPDRIDYYIDGKKTSSIPANADMAKPMYLIANLAVGGNWPGYPDASVRFPATMDIDYIRVWRFRGKPGATR